MAELLTPNDLLVYPSLAALGDLASQCEAAEGAVKAYLGRRVLTRQTGVVSEVVARSSPQLWGLEYPIWTVSSVVRDGVTLPANSYEIGTAGATKCFVRRLPRGQNWEAGEILTATYEAGYEAASQELSVLKSVAVRLAVLRSLALVSLGVEGGRQVKKYKLGDYEVEYESSDLDRAASGALPSSLRSLLSPYRARMAY